MSTRPSGGQGDTAHWKTMVSDLQSEKEVLQSEKQELETKVANLEAEVEKANTKLEERVAELQAEVDSAQAHILSLANRRTRSKKEHAHHDENTEQDVRHG